VSTTSGSRTSSDRPTRSSSPRKIHGCNARFGYWKDEFWVGSHNSWRKRDERNLWWQVAKQYDLETKLKSQGLEGFIVYGEVYGHKVQDLAYGCKVNERGFRVFDVYDADHGLWLTPSEVADFCKDHGLEQVPVFYRGPYAPEAFEHLKDGPSTFDPKQIREGFVIRLATPRYHEHLGTRHVVLKSVGEEYLLRKGGTEYH
jgi:RNA ligase (TIGR02306 family)